MTIPIFCINLERAIERRNLIQTKWIDGLSLDINFWPAYDRRDIEKGKTIYPYNKENARQSMGRELSDGEQACCTSFCMLYEYLIENSYQEAIIMEDDIHPVITDKKELFSIINQGKKEFPQSEIMLLFNPREPLKIKRDINQFVICKTQIWGNQLVYMKNIGIRKQYNLLRTMNKVADYRNYGKNTIIISKNPLCTHDWSGENSTTYIGNNFRNTKRKFII